MNLIRFSFVLAICLLAIVAIPGFQIGSTAAIPTPSLASPLIAPPSLAPAPDLVTGAHPYYVTSADFNNDGKIDIATTNSADNTLSVFIGVGDGTFLAAIGVPVGNRPLWIAVGDFNGDNKSDMTVTSYFGNNVGVLMGNGDGTFQNPTYYSTGQFAYSVVADDVNGDHKVDLVVVNYTCYQCNSTVSVLLGNGNGTFQSATNSLTGGQGSQSHSIADLNEDGDKDLITSSADSNNVNVRLGNGDGTFQNAVNYSTDTNPVVVVLGDFNNDSHLDLAATAYFDNRVNVRLGNGDGTFGSPLNSSCGNNPGQVVVGDFDSDGKLDLAVTNVTSGSASVIIGNGGGLFPTRLQYPTGSSPFSLAAADFNGDTQIDLAVANRDSNTTSVLLSDIVRPITNAATASNANAAGWNNSNVSVALSASDNAGGSGVSQITYSASGAQTIASTTVNGASVNLSITAEGETTISYFAEDSAGNTEAAQTLIMKIDKSAPSISCDSADGVWHPNDVSIPCTANDSVSGLNNEAEGSFNLTTNVPPNTETSNASTDSRTVCDVADNCATAGPISGNKIDKKAPTITITTPSASAVYLLNQSVGSNYTCTDGGSGVASCAGPVANGSNIDTASAGSKTFTVNATDQVGNSATQSVAYSVGYGVVALYDQTKVHKSGSTIPIKIQIVDTNGANYSSASLVVQAVSVTLISTNSSGTPEDAGNSNPDLNFRYDAALGGYIFNLQTTGYAAGTYSLNFMVAGDPTLHSLQFRIRS